MDNPIMILLLLLLSHVLVDFVFQHKKTIANKRKYKARSWHLYLHSFAAGAVAYLLLMQWNWWMVPVIIAVSHFLIDLWKLYQKKDDLKRFLIDQSAHILVLLLLWLYLINGYGEFLEASKQALNSIPLITIVLGYLTVIFPVGFIIGKATIKWQKDIERDGEESLDKAGRYIGIFERILVLTFILINQFSAIGFLIAAKSILRFSDAKNARKQTEYVLIGTLMSFAICIIIGLAVKFLVRL